MNIMNTLLLASNSPRRSDFLKQCHYQFSVIPSNVDETIEEGLPLEEVVCTLALRKAKHVAGMNRNSVVLGADTVVSYEGNQLGKPRSKQEAREMLMLLAGNTHDVCTGVAIVKGEQVSVFCEIARVTMTSITTEQLDRYLRSDDSLDKAGAYGIQSLGGMFVSRLEGDFYAVAGLPLSRTVKELERFQIYPHIS